MRRAARRDLEAFTRAVFTWLEVAPCTWEQDWVSQPVQLKVYFGSKRTRGPGKTPTNALGLPAKKPRKKAPQWIPSTDAARRFVKERAYPIEVLAVAAWDLIKALPIHIGALHGNDKVSDLFRSKETSRRALQLIRAGNKTLLDRLAQAYGYIDADDERIPLKDRKQPPHTEPVRRGNRAKTHAERRKPMHLSVRKRWPKPPPHLLDMPPRMLSYWRTHACYEEAMNAFKSALPVFRPSRRSPRSNT